MAHVLGLRGGFEGTVKAINQTILPTPNDADAWFMKGAGLEQLHHFREAIDSFRKAAQMGHARARQAMLGCERKLNS
jgi:Flp pilus assembly protein TadD